MSVEVEGVGRAGQWGSTRPPEGSEAGVRPAHAVGCPGWEWLALAELPSPAQAGGRGLGVLSDDFQRTVASSILKWVVSQQNCSRSTPKGWREKAGDSDPSNRQGVCRLGMAEAVPPREDSGRRGHGAVHPGRGCSSAPTPSLFQQNPTGMALLGRVGSHGPPWV